MHLWILLLLLDFFFFCSIYSGSDTRMSENREPEPAAIVSFLKLSLPC